MRIDFVEWNANLIAQHVIMLTKFISGKRYQINYRYVYVHRYIFYMQFAFSLLAFFNCFIWLTIFFSNILSYFHILADAYNHIDLEILKSKNNQNKDVGSRASTAICVCDRLLVKNDVEDGYYMQGWQW